jgi:hypothetical protein
MGQSFMLSRPKCSEPGSFGGGLMRGVPLMRDHSNSNCIRGHVANIAITGNAKAADTVKDWHLVPRRLAEAGGAEPAY